MSQAAEATPIAFCPECGAKVKPGARFCGECGTRLRTSGSQPSEPGSSPGAAAQDRAAARRLGEVIGDFRLERMIARGGMGVVYLALQLRLGRRVALKLIAPELARDAVFRERFKREALLAAALESPHIVPVYDAAEADGELYLAMRFIDGLDLRTLIAAEGALAPYRAAGIVSQLASALDVAHRQGLVHRDCKPSNALLGWAGSEEVAYLSDFGLIKRLGEDSGATVSGRWVGTVDYAAPEQIEGGTVDPRTDTYALACVLFKAITGSVPFPRDSDAAVMYAHLHQPPPDPRSLRPELPPALTEVIAHGMAKDPHERFQTAAALGRAALAASAPGASQGSGRLRRRRPRV